MSYILWMFECKKYLDNFLGCVFKLKDNELYNFRSSNFRFFKIESIYVYYSDPNETDF